jgi:hypothetical protein
MKYSTERPFADPQKAARKAPALCEVIWRRGKMIGVQFI